MLVPDKLYRNEKLFNVAYDVVLHIVIIVSHSRAQFEHFERSPSRGFEQASRVRMVNHSISRAVYEKYRAFNIGDEFVIREPLSN